MFLSDRHRLLLDKPGDDPSLPANPPTPPGPGDPPPKSPVDPNQLPLDPNLVDPPAPTSYSADVYNKLLVQKKALEDKNKTATDLLKANELTQMKDKEQWKEIAELKETENTELKQKNEALTKGVAQREKMAAIRTAAVRLGIRKEALDDLEFLDFPEVQIETTSLGNYNVVGAQTAVETLKLKKPHWFGKTSGKLNGSLPEVVNGGMVTIDQIMKAEEKSRLTSTPESQAEYKRLTQLYNQQKTR